MTSDYTNDVDKEVLTKPVYLFQQDSTYLSGQGYRMNDVMYVVLTLWQGHNFQLKPHSMALFKFTDGSKISLELSLMDETVPNDRSDTYKFLAAGKYMISNQADLEALQHKRLESVTISTNEKDIVASVEDKKQLDLAEAVVCAHEYEILD